MQGEAGRQAMVAIGIQVGSWAVEDYRIKGRGRTDESGTRWKPIRRESIAARLIQRQIGLPVRLLLRKGSGNRRRNAAIIYLAANDPEFMPAFYRAVSREFSRHEIGTNTGRLNASLTFGIPNMPRPGPIQHTTEQPSKAVWIVTPTSVELGSRQRYAGWFAKTRPIFPKGMLSPRRKKVLAVLWARIAIRVLN